MKGSLKLTLKRPNVSCVVTLLSDLAPATCKAVIEAVPFEGRALHARYAGREIWTPVPASDALRSLPFENRTFLPAPGDILYGFFPAASNGGSRGATADVCDFAVVYGRDTVIWQPDGLHPMNHFGSITENFDEFADACERLLFEGADVLTVARES